MNDRRPALMVDLLLSIRGLAAFNMIHLHAILRRLLRSNVLIWALLVI